VRCKALKRVRGQLTIGTGVDDCRASALLDNKEYSSPSEGAEAVGFNSKDVDSVHASKGQMYPVVFIAVFNLVFNLMRFIEHGQKRSSLNQMKNIWRYR
jgi:hypothetical protein